VAKPLCELARRILPFPEGDFSPSAPPHLLISITDGLLVVASDAIAAVAEEAEPSLSGKAKLRLLAWTLADARGAQVPLEKPLAETIGKRLERQAQRVRETLAAAAVGAQEARARARAAAANDAALAAELAATIEDIDACLADKRSEVREEVYVGFHELDSLLKPGSVSSPATPATPSLGQTVVDRLSDALDDLTDVPRGESYLNGLLQRAMEHIIVLDARLERERGVSADLRSRLIVESGRAARADARADDAEWELKERERWLWDEEERWGEATGALQDELAEAQIDGDVLRRRVKELEDELWSLSG